MFALGMTLVNAKLTVLNDASMFSQFLFTSCNVALASPYVSKWKAL